MYCELVKIIPFLSLWKAAQSLESTSNTNAEEDKDVEDTESNVKKQNTELKMANKELWKRVEDLQKEKNSLAQENTELKRKIELPPTLPGNTLLNILLSKI